MVVRLSRCPLESACAVGSFSNREIKKLRQLVQRIQNVTSKYDFVLG